MSEISVQPWEGDEYVVCFSGKPVGQTLHRRDAESIKGWLETTDIVAALLERDALRAEVERFHNPESLSGDEAAKFCPFKDPLHFHHDGCPSEWAVEKRAEKAEAERDEWRDKATKRVTRADLEEKIEAAANLNLDEFMKPGYSYWSFGTDDFINLLRSIGVVVADEEGK